MLQRIKLNLEEIESMLYFWQATNDREKVSEVYLSEVASMKGLSASYTSDFDAESVRKVLSAITNKELLSTKTQREGRFWNNNMWMMEDLSYTDMMARPLKKLNLDNLPEELGKLAQGSRFDELEVRISPLSTEEYIIADSRLIINFFRVKPSDLEDDSASINGIELKEYIKQKITELLAK